MSERVEHWESVSGHGGATVGTREIPPAEQVWLERHPITPDQQTNVVLIHALYALTRALQASPPSEAA